MNPVIKDLVGKKKGHLFSSKNTFFHFLKKESFLKQLLRKITGNHSNNALHSMQTGWLLQNTQLEKYGAGYRRG